MHIKCILSVQMNRKIDEQCVSESLFLSGKRKRKNATYIFVCATKKCKKCLSFCLASQSQGKLVTFLNWTTFLFSTFFFRSSLFAVVRLQFTFSFFSLSFHLFVNIKLHFNSIITSNFKLPMFLNYKKKSDFEKILVNRHKTN